MSASVNTISIRSGRSQSIIALYRPIRGLSKTKPTSSICCEWPLSYADHLRFSAFSGQRRADLLDHRRDNSQATNRIRERTVRANGLDFPILKSGSGRLVLCLHGFPDHAQSWAHFLDRLAQEESLSHISIRPPVSFSRTATGFTLCRRSDY